MADEFQDVYALTTANHVAGFWNTNSELTEPYFGDGTAFRHERLSGDQVSIVKGSDVQPKLLDQTDRDAKAIPLDRGELETASKEVPGFKNSMIVNEKDIRDFKRAQQSRDTVLVDTILNKIYNDQATLLRNAAYRREAMAMEVLTTGQLKLANKKIIDYGLKAWQKTKSKADWGADGSNPYDDIYAIQETAAQKVGATLGRAVMNRRTFSKLVRNGTLKSTLLANNANTAAAFLPNSVVTDFLYSELGLSIKVYNKGYNDAAGAFHTFVPDDLIAFLPETDSIGRMAFATTPEEEESSRLSGTVATVDTGVSIHVYDQQDPVARTTKVDQWVLPTLDVADQIALMNVSGK
ncbi:major capsid protein [Secundilactobacillus kimchicus]|uniref:major capsid protein n=1 Tax=Secundilactobacillus kimchicus TaxID=528209 RepID=UPI0024A83CBF|nr:major capsid protein [Secundilactobacillus kimchicus]